MRNLALMWVLAGCLLGCGGGDKDAKDKAASAADAVRVDSVQSWKSGETTVTLNDGILTVSGEGAMENYSYDSTNYTPWRLATSTITGLVIEKGVTSIGNYAFARCTSLTSVTIPDGVNTIGERAFYHCKNLTSITIPNSVTYIGIEAFYDCWRMEYAKIMGSAQIDKEAFKECRSLQYIIILNPIPPPRWSFYSVSSNACMYVPKNSIDAYIATYNTGYITAADFYSGGIIRGSKSSLAWGSKRFECVKDLALAPIVVDNVIFNYDTTELIQYLTDKQRTSYTIPVSVSVIRPMAFLHWYCIGLMSIEVATDNVHYSSDDGVLFNKDKTQLIQYPGDKQGVSYAIPDGVTVISPYAFTYCDNLQSITIPNSVTTIGNEAFADCNNLQSITIPNSVTTIGNGAFSSCGSLQSITVKNPIPPEIGNYAFDFISPNACLYVPKGSEAAYNLAEEWKEFGCIKEIDDGFTGVRITVIFLALLVLSAVVFVIVKKSRIKQEKERRK